MQHNHKIAFYIILLLCINCIYASPQKPYYFIGEQPLIDHVINRNRSQKYSNTSQQIHMPETNANTQICVSKNILIPSTTTKNISTQKGSAPLSIHEKSTLQQRANSSHKNLVDLCKNEENKISAEKNNLVSEDTNNDTNYSEELLFDFELT